MVYVVAGAGFATAVTDVRSNRNLLFVFASR
jgi:hypothetical protein